MGNSIVTLFTTIAGVSVLFAIILGLGKKYHDEDQAKKHDL
jgi:hypothetical protein